MSANQLCEIVIRLLAFGGPEHVMTNEEKLDAGFREALVRGVVRMEQYYLRATGSLVLQAKWCEDGLRLNRASLLNGKLTIAGTWPGSTLAPRRDDLAIATLRGVLDGSVVFGSVQDLPDCRHMSGEVLTNLLVAHLGLDDPARDPQCAYRAWNWSMLDAEMASELAEGVGWLRVSRGTDGSMSVKKIYHSEPEEREEIWPNDAPCSLQAARTWMEWEDIGESIAGRMSDGNTGVALAIGTGEGRRWHFAVPATGLRSRDCWRTLEGLVGYAHSSDDWPTDSPIREWLKGVG